MSIYVKLVRLMCVCCTVFQ